METYSTYYIERADRSHVILAEWSLAISETPGVRSASSETADHTKWHGYNFNPLSTVHGAFYTREDRQFDAGVLVDPANNTWQRALYWNWGAGKAWGVITYHADEDQSDPIRTAAQAIAECLKARIAFEDHTWYED